MDGVLKCKNLYTSTVLHIISIHIYTNGTIVIPVYIHPFFSMLQVLTSCSRIITVTGEESQNYIMFHIVCVLPIRRVICKILLSTSIVLQFKQ